MLSLCKRTIYIVIKFKWLNVKCRENGFVKRKKIYVAETIGALNMYIKGGVWLFARG